MSDPINAVCKIMYHVVIICTGSGCRKPQENQWKYWCIPDVKFWRDFKEKPPAEHCLNTYVVKKAKSDTTHCERLCPAGVIALSFTSWPTARLFSWRDPHNSSWMICILHLSSNLRKSKIRRFLFIPDPILFVLDPKIFVATDHLKDLLLSCPTYLCRIRIYSCRVRVY